VERQNQTALRVAQWLEAHPGIERVYYPGLASHPDAAIAGQLRGHGGVVSFLVRGDLDTTSKFIDGCTIATIAPSLGGVETLIEQPALMSHYELTTEERLQIGFARTWCVSRRARGCGGSIADLHARSPMSRAPRRLATPQTPHPQEASPAKSNGAVDVSKGTRRVEEAVSSCPVESVQLSWSRPISAPPRVDRVTLFVLGKGRSRARSFRRSTNTKRASSNAMGYARNLGPL